MKIALLGYGNMGKAIEQVALERGHEIVLRLTSATPSGWENLLQQADVAIEFSTPETVLNHIRICFALNVPVVVGTTAWYAHFDELVTACVQSDQSLFYATNFSIGVNLFFEVNKHLASLMAAHGEYAASLEEIHHIRKKDAPSGTAISIAEQLISNHSGYDSWKLQSETNLQSEPHSLPVTSVRTDDVPGTHVLKYTSAIDQLEISHTAFNRKGFASGALLAASFLAGKKGVFTMSDLLNLKSPYGH